MTTRTVTRKPARRRPTTRRPAKRRGNFLSRPLNRAARRTKNKTKRTLKRNTIKLARFLAKTAATGIALIGKGILKTALAAKRAHQNRHAPAKTRTYCPSCNAHGKGHGGHCAARGT